MFFGRGNNDPFTRWLTPGHQQLRQDVDLVFARNGIAFTLGTDMRIARLGPPEARKLISDLRPATGDARLDDLLNDATTRFLSRDLADRQIALEKLWDAFERLKTLRRGGQKRASLEELLAEAFPSTKEFRDRVNVEFRTLTDIGNEFPIRHDEHDRYELPAGASDYLFIRLVAIISYVLRQTGLMSPSSL